jgi:hypothetical protein
VGGVDPPLVVYQQVAGRDTNLRLNDANSKTRRTLPAGVNTFDWEWEPSISGHWLLFGRQTANAQFVILQNLEPPEEQVVLDQGARFRHAGQVNGDFAVWTRCTKTTCNVVRREIMPETDTVLPKPSTKYQDGAAVTSTGIVYVARSGPKCRTDVKMVRYFGAGDPPGGKVVADLGTNGRDFWSAYARDNADGSVDVFYDRYVCGTGKSDIYRINDPHPGPSRAARARASFRVRRRPRTRPRGRAGPGCARARSRRRGEDGAPSRARRLRVDRRSRPRSAP